MAQLKILISGYAKEVEKGWIASSTTVLIQENDLNIIIDPGINRKLLLERFSEADIRLADVDYVFITHHHPDHCYLSAIFENARILDDTYLYEDDKETEHQAIIPETNLKIIHTPGHEDVHASLAVPAQKGMYIVAGDVFWWNDDENQKVGRDSLMQHRDPLAKDMATLAKSRDKILKIADYVIPGHGQAFQVK